MKTYKILTAETKDTLDLKGIIEVYEEIAAGKMQKIRVQITTARDFFDRLEVLSSEVGADFNLIKTTNTNREIAVLITTNTGLYGDIVDSTFQLFLAYITSHPVDVFVIGKMGENLLQQMAPTIKFKAFPLPDAELDQAKFFSLLGEIFPYRKISLFYGKFKNIAVQSPVMSSISSDILPKTDADIQELKHKRMQYLYEPSLLDITDIFAKEIAVSLMEQVMHESLLAKLASRVMYLDQSTDKVLDLLDSLAIEKRQLKKKLADKKQNAVTSSLLARGLA